ncbi:MAG: hypothetical protein LBC76_10720 [Treponema sp.]|nr:hypothetical protein [Treponema sp.]
MFKYGILVIGIMMLVILPASAADKTDVIITRVNSSVENNRPVSIYIDDVRVGTLMPGRRLEIRVDNGSHTISVKITPNKNKEIMSDYYFIADDTKTLQFRIHIEKERVLLLKKTIIFISELED